MTKNNRRERSHNLEKIPWIFSASVILGKNNLRLQRFWKFSHTNDLVQNLLHTLHTRARTGTVLKKIKIESHCLLDSIRPARAQRHCKFLKYMLNFIRCVAFQTLIEI